MVVSSQEVIAWETFDKAEDVEFHDQGEDGEVSLRRDILLETSQWLANCRPNGVSPTDNRILGHSTWKLYGRHKRGFTRCPDPRKR